ncbi:hypothetical protein [Nitratidesulfovibrio termitidis]|uniref:hypothetical protein n=1 Tax=Nitratidesulfovibrio termitidis TaxID=42252 RepID=UPI0018DCB5B1|nr:hypothetical protein [Nitratidesulfovibrio termitidis]
MAKRKVGLSEVQHKFVSSTLEDACRTIYDINIDIILYYGPKSPIAKISRKVFWSLLDVLRNIPVFTDYGDSNVDTENVLRDHAGRRRAIFDYDKHCAVGVDLNALFEKMCVVARCFDFAYAKSNSVNKKFNLYLKNVVRLTSALGFRFKDDCFKGENNVEASPYSL